MSSEKTLPPSSKKIREAREEGQVAKSTELAAGVQLGIILLYLYLWGDNIWQDLSAMTLNTLDKINYPLNLALYLFLSDFKDFLLKDILFLLVILFFASALTYIAQVGFLFSVKAAMPKLEKLDVIKNLQNIFSIKSLVELIKNIIKMTTIGIIFYYLLLRYAPSLRDMVYLSPVESMHVTIKIIFWLWGALVLCYIIFFLADYAYQRYELMKSLRMSHEDVKQEYKEMEGNTEIKNHRKSLHREIQSGSLANTVKRSTAVIRNPTHVAICIYYEENITPLPQVIAKGVGELAKNIIKIAEQEGVPIIENIPLARGLNKKIPLGGYIQPAFFAAVSEILMMLKAGESMND